ncbi:MAG TPA: FAD-binding protein [Ktedonobacteraceae bacterium]|nr:FAD-binding protein [Ktedonobacteraceae bacterium]
MSEMATEQSFLMGKMRRRDFLALSALGIAMPGALIACANGSPQGNNPTPTATSTKAASPTATPSPTAQATPTGADWAQLAKSLQGTLVLPGSSQYSTALQLFDPRFDSIHPAAIAYCVSPMDVQQCLAFVQKFNLPLAARSGGHSYAGYSTTTGLVVDVTRMNTVVMNTGNGTATIGAGAHLIDVYSTLSNYGVVIPAGSCPTVGIAGLTLGGGIGVIGRKFGLTCDNLLAAQIVLANGTVLTCDAHHNADLFWALRGGGGGNFGVTTSFTFQTHPVSSLSLFTLDWPWSSAAEVVSAWQNWAPPAPDELWSNCLLLATSPKSSGPQVRVNGVYVGSISILNQLLQQLTSQVSAAPTGRYVYNDSLLETMMVEAGCYGMSVAACHLPSQNPQGQLQRVPYAARSDFFTSTLPSQGINALVNAIASRQASSLGEGGIAFDASGGAINRVAANATAFVHRNDLFSVQYTANWNASDPSSVISANQTWLNGVWQSMRPYASGNVYQNYVDPNLPNYLQAYYGSNLPRLQQVKATYDPTNLFHFAQSIPLPG